jgi:hypothetical protein
LNVQASASLATFADEIVDPAASRVLARSAFEYAHDPEPAVGAAPCVVTVVHAGLAGVVPLPPHAAAVNPAATSSTAQSAMLPPMLRTPFESMILFGAGSSIQIVAVCSR